VKKRKKSLIDTVSKFANGGKSGGWRGEKRKRPGAIDKRKNCEKKRKQREEREWSNCLLDLLTVGK